MSKLRGLDYRNLEYRIPPDWIAQMPQPSIMPSEFTTLRHVHGDLIQTITPEFIKRLMYKTVNRMIRDSDLNVKHVTHMTRVPESIQNHNLSYVFPFIGELIGSGCYSSVYRMAGDERRVVKIRLRAPNTDENDVWKDGWLEWAAFAMHNRGKSPLLPEIHELCITNNFYMAIMKRYKCTVTQYGGDEKQNQYDMIKRGIRHDSPRDEFWTLGYELSKLPMFPKQLLSNDDMHGNNAMLDENNNIVITDPLATDRSGPSKQAWSMLVAKNESLKYMSNGVGEQNVGTDIGTTGVLCVHGTAFPIAQ